MRRDPDWLDPTIAERLLGGGFADRGRGDTAGRRHGPEALARLLSAAAGPASRDELVREQEAVDAFRAARLGGAGTVQRPSAARRALSRVLTLKTAAVAITVAATGGVAVAATSGALPIRLAERTAPTAAPGTAHAPVDSSPRPSATAGRQASPSPSLVGLCRSYTAGRGDNPGKALDNPAFAALIDAAGGRDRVAAYCAAVLEEADKNGHPHPSNNPGKGPGDKAHQPSGKPEKLDKPEKSKPATPEPPGEAAGQS
jgi:hypothetical protein